MAIWHTVESARDQWADAPYDEDGGDDTLTELLVVAQGAVLAFAPVLTESEDDLILIDGILVPNDGEVIPTNYRVAQLMQARNVWNSSKASPGTGEFDNGSYGLSSFPLDWQIRQLLRPKQGRPVIA
jgi:hypothetical protein